VGSRLQIIIPCYNEANRLAAEPFLQAIATTPDLALLFVDDGSIDETADVLARLVALGGGRISVVTLPRNGGKSQAVRQGVIAAFERQPDVVGYWDADLSTPLSAIRDLLNVMETHPEVDIVIGSRVKLLGRHITRSAFRHYTGRLFATVTAFLLRMAVYDTQCGAKLFRVNDQVRRAFAEPFRSRWIVDVEILARYIALKGVTSAASSICEVPLQTWTEKPGSKLRMRHAFRAMWDLVRVPRPRSGS